MSEPIAEYAGLTAEAVALIEGLRKSPSETKSQILVRALAPLQLQAKENDEFIDYKEGIQIRKGEPIFLFLSKEAKSRNLPDATAEVHSDGFYLDGVRFGPSDKRQFTPAMKTVQKRKQHVNRKGEIISLSALRQWHVIRDNELRSLEQIKDPKLARRRGNRMWKGIDLDDLGL